MQVGSVQACVLDGLANTLLSKWMSPEGKRMPPKGKPSKSQSLFTRMGKWDLAMRFVMTADGPQFWRFDDARMKQARKFGAIHYYTMDFGNSFSRHLFETGGQVAPAMMVSSRHLSE